MKDTHLTLESWQNRWSHCTFTNAWLAICCLASGILAEIISSNRPLWLDELYMLITVRRPFMDGLLQTEDYSAPLYQLISRTFVYTDTPSIFLFRLPALLAAMLGLLSIWWLAKNFFNTKVAAISIFIIGFNPCFLNYATEARPYTLLLLFSVLSYGMFYKCLISYNRIFFLAYICFSVMLVYSHYFGFLVFPAQALALLVYVFHTRKTTILKRMVYAFGTVVLLSIPAFYLISRHTSAGLTALQGIPKSSLSALFLTHSGTTFFADKSLCILCIWPLFVLGCDVLNRLRLQECLEANSEELGIQPGATWYLAPLLTVAWLALSWYLLVIVSCVKPGYSDRYAFPALVPCVFILCAITANAPRRVTVLILMIAIFSYAYHIKEKMDYARPDLPELATQLQSVNNSDTKVWIPDWPKLNDIEPAQPGLRYYGYSKTNISRLTLVLKTDKSVLEIQEPGVLQNYDHFFVVTRKPEYEHIIDEYLKHADLQYSKVRFDWLALYDVNRQPTNFDAVQK